MTEERKFIFGQWVLVNGEKSGQIIGYHGKGWYCVDFLGNWERFHERDIEVDEKYTQVK